MSAPDVSPLADGMRMTADELERHAAWLRGEAMHVQAEHDAALSEEPAPAAPGDPRLVPGSVWRCLTDGEVVRLVGPDPSGLDEWEVVIVASCEDGPPVGARDWRSMAYDPLPWVPHPDPNAAEAERDRLRAEVDRMRPVVLAAENWIATQEGSGEGSDYVMAMRRELLDAVRAYREGEA